MCLSLIYPALSTYLLLSLSLSSLFSTTRSTYQDQHPHQQQAAPDSIEEGAAGVDVGAKEDAAVLVGRGEVERAESRVENQFFNAVNGVQ